MSTLPEHTTIIPADRMAFAPYNFVPLPEKAVPAELVPEGQRILHQCAEAPFLVRHNQYFAERHTGTITCTLTTETPLYVRCGLTPAEFARSMREVEEQQTAPSAQATPIKNKPDFFDPSNQQRAVIPGSSLRGLFRSMIEIVSHSKLDLVTNKKLFYRSVDKTNLGKHYSNPTTAKNYMYIWSFGKSKY